MKNGNKAAASLLEIALKAEPIDVSKEEKNRFLKIISENQDIFQKEFEKECTEEFLRKAQTGEVYFIINDLSFKNRRLKKTRIVPSLTLKFCCKEEYPTISVTV